MKRFLLALIPITLLLSLSEVTLVTDTFGQSNRLEFSRPLMGTEVRIVLFAGDSLTAAEAVHSAFSRMTELNGILSDYLIDSEVSHLSQTHNQPMKVSTDLWNVLLTAQEVSYMSQGGFDVTIGPLTLIWRKAMRRATFPNLNELKIARQSVGSDLLKIDQNQPIVELKKGNMRIDLGGIAKGYIADQALNILISRGFSQAAVDAGGDIALGDAPPNLDGWTIQVFEEAPDQLSIVLKNCGIAVSGDRYRYLEHHGVRYSHIIDPRTGLGVTHERRVAVVAPTAMIADAWTSAYSVMDWKGAKDSAENHEGLDILMIQKSANIKHQINTGKFLRN